MITPPRGPRARAAAALACLALIASGCGGGGDEPLPSASASATPTTGASAGPSGQPSGGTVVDQAALAKFHDQKLDWSGCGGIFQCVKVKVPVDYSQPDGATLNLAVTRLRTDSSKRIGSLLINPGGPGGSGVGFLQAAYTAITEPVRANYDLVSFDPRGVGNSKPIDCLTDDQLSRFVAADVTMDDPEDLPTYDRLVRDFVERCDKNNGPLLGEVDTDNVARDLDVLRAVLGDETLHYLGYSYGTFIGARYAEMFPDKVGRLVLDGAVQPDLGLDALSFAQAQGFERAWDAFVQACLKDKDCQLGDKRGEVDTRVRAMLNAADNQPLRTRAGRAVSEATATYGILAALYNQQRWEFLRSAIFAAYNGDGTALLLLADTYLERDPAGRFEGNANEVITAVNCLDRPYTGTLEQIQAQVPRFREASPIFGEFIVWGLLPCIYWSAKPDHGPVPVTAGGAAPIIVIGTTRDPATPYEWAKALANQLESGIFVSHDGDGHTVYGEGNRCIDRLVEDYLINGETPRDGVECD
jgi:pimeloyl-ACP methyl ester carboxylesterase